MPGENFFRLTNWTCLILCTLDVLRSFEAISMAKGEMTVPIHSQTSKPRRPGKVGLQTKTIEEKWYKVKGTILNVFAVAPVILTTMFVPRYIKLVISVAKQCISLRYVPVKISSLLPRTNHLTMTYYGSYMLSRYQQKIPHPVLMLKNGS